MQRAARGSTVRRAASACLALCAAVWVGPIGCAHETFPGDCEVRTTVAPGGPDRERQALEWRSPVLRRTSDVKCNGTSAATAGDAISILFGDFQVELRSNDGPLSARKTLRATLPVRLLNASRLRPMRLTVRGEVFGAPGAGASVRLRVKQGSEAVADSADFTLTRNRASEGPVLLAVDLPPPRGQDLEREYGLRLAASAARRGSDDDVQVVIDAMEIAVAPGG